MSTNLYYEIPVNSSYLGKDLKYIIAPLIWKHDGTLGGEDFLIDKETTVYRDDENINLYNFLKGVAASSNNDASKEAEKLTKLIDKHNAVFISLKG